MYNQSWNNPMYNSQSSTNIVYVTGPEEAVMRAGGRGSDEVFFDQSKPVFYRVKVDYDGRKTWAAFPYKVDNVDNTCVKSDTPVNPTAITRDEFDILVKEVKELRGMLITKEVSAHE